MFKILEKLKGITFVRLSISIFFFHFFPVRLLVILVKCCLMFVPAQLRLLQLPTKSSSSNGFMEENLNEIFYVKR